MSNFSYAEFNANELEQRILLICIRFGMWEVRRLKFELGLTVINWSLISFHINAFVNYFYSVFIFLYRLPKIFPGLMITLQPWEARVRQMFIIIFRFIKTRQTESWKFRQKFFLHFVQMIAQITENVWILPASVTKTTQQKIVQYHWKTALTYLV